MARVFILAGDEGKYADKSDGRFPLVVDLLPEAVNFAAAKIQKIFPYVITKLSTSDKKDGELITDNFNYLIELWFKDWPEL